MADTWGGSWGTSWGGSWGSGFTPAPAAPTIPPGGGRYIEWWEREWARIREERAKRKKAKLPKKKREVLDELDEILLELRSRIDEAPVEKKVIEDYRAADQFYRNALNAEYSLKEMRAYRSLVLAILQEIDDEEAILLAIH
jgi:hypothetical protein